MCGIVGIFEPHGGDRSQRDAIVRDMAGQLHHRGPDGSGLWSDDHVSLAHRRLAIVDLSPLGAQPMVSQSHRYVLSFNGEIYNFVELRGELEASGVQFRGHSDTEVLLALIECHGLARALQACIGMFAISLWDRREQRLSLARDRMGEKPLYYGWCGNALVFGSELKALTVHPQFDHSPSPSAIKSVIADGYVAPDESIYLAANQIHAGCIMSWQAGAASAVREAGRQERFWDRHAVIAAAQDDPFDGSIDAAADALHAVLADAVALQSRADVPVGVFLSGGVDSSLVTALMSSHAPGNVRSYSIGFRSDAYNEAEVARAVAEHLGTSHRDRYVAEEEALAVVPSLLDVYDEPFADSSQIPTMILARLAREDVTVALSGDGADEVLGGYGKYVRGERLWQSRSRRFLGPALTGLDAMTRRTPGISRWPGLQRVPFHSIAAGADLLTIEGRHEFIRSVGSLNRRPECFMAEPMRPIHRTCNHGENRQLSYRRAAMMEDMGAYLPGDILTKVDRATMASSLECRAPFLDHRVFELCASFPDALLFDQHGGGKRVAKHLLYRLVDRKLVDRPKTGFKVPLGDWLRGEMRVWAGDLLASAATATVLDVPRARALLEKHWNEPHDLSARLWPLLSLAAWAGRARSRG